MLVWNERQRVEAEELHGIPADRVVATGAQQFDEWFERRPSGTREEFLARVGLDPAERYVLYLCSSPDITRPAKGERAFVESWIEAVRGSADELLRQIGILVRPHPNPAATNQWRRADLARFGNAVVWPSGGARPVGEEASAGFFDSLFHSDAVVGINTTSMIEAAIVGKSVLTIRAPQFAQESTLHFHHLLAENGGFLHVAESLEEHAGAARRSCSSTIRTATSAAVRSWRRSCGRMGSTGRRRRSWRTPSRRRRTSRPIRTSAARSHCAARSPSRRP